MKRRHSSPAAGTPAPGATSRNGRLRDGVARRPLRVGTDFSGCDMVIEVLKRLEVPHDHIFSCDIDPHCRALIQHCHRPQNLFVDIRKRPIGAVPDIDLYVFGPPLHGFLLGGLAWRCG